MSNVPAPNTQALSWFYGENEKKTLDLKPKYQRNTIWSIGQKCFLIDSLISGCPIPQVFLNIVSQGSGAKRRTIYEVVDGQQRLRTILEFMNDEWALVKTTANSYPVSKEYKPHIGKRYSQLPESFQTRIWDYQLAVQELRGWSSNEIRALFRRLNYVVEKLNKQELRHSQYFGEFVSTVERLTDDSLWDEIGIFKRRDFQRMKDVEYVSELFVTTIDGIQDGQRTLDKFYALYDVEFPRRTTYMLRFRVAKKSIETIATYIAGSRFRKKADFYALFVAILQITTGRKHPIDLRKSIPKLERFEEGLDGNPASMGRLEREYYDTVVEGPNKLAKRERRAEILKSLLDTAS